MNLFKFMYFVFEKVVGKFMFILFFFEGIYVNRLYLLFCYIRRLGFKNCLFKIVFYLKVV